MSAYVDTLSKCEKRLGWRHTSSCHLIADTTDELMRFATSIGCKVEWAKTSRKGVLHFDLSPKMRELAAAKGAKEINRHQLAAMLRRG